MKSLAVKTGLADENTQPQTAARAFIDKIREINKNMNIPSKLAVIKAEDIPEMAVHAEKEANPLYPVPKLMTAKELEKLYFIAMEEE